jgi:hypothetical protein
MARITPPASGGTGTSVPVPSSGDEGKFVTVRTPYSDGYGLVTGGAALRYSTDVGNGSATTFTINHALNTLDVIPSCREKAGGKQFQFPTFVSVDANNITVTFAVAPTASQYRITVVA